MSFRTNLSYPKKYPTQGSIIHSGKQIIATSIGVTANRTMLSCRMNIDGQDCHYFKADSEIMQIFSIADSKLKREAFQKIQKYTHYHHEQKNSVFLLEALHKGNYGVISKFLERLKKNRVESYVKLNIQESKGHFLKPLTLIKSLTELFISKIREPFLKMKRHMHRQRQKFEKLLLQNQLQKISCIQRQNNIGSKQKQPKANIINVSYTCVKTERAKLGEISNKRTNTANKFSRSEKQPECFDLKNIMQTGKVKQYQFKNSNVKRVSFDRIKTSRKP